MIIFFWDHLHDQYHQHLDHLHQQFLMVSPTPPPLSSPAFTPSNNLYDSQTQALIREKEKILDDKIYELPDDPPKLELGDDLANIL